MSNFIENNGDVAIVGLELIILTILFGALVATTLMIDLFVSLGSS